MSTNPIMSNNQPLSKEQIISIAPSIYSDEPIDSVSQRYKFVPTYKIIPTLKEAGFYPILVGQSKSRSENDKLYTKHILQFRHISHLMQPDEDEEYLDVVITSAHNAKSSFSIDLAIVRQICQNTLYTPSESFIHHKIRHTGFTTQKVRDAIEEIKTKMPKIKEEVNRFKNLRLTPIEEMSLAQTALNLRFDKNVHDVNVEQFLKVSREEDKENSLWVVYNRIQEAMIRGGLKGINKLTEKKFTSKPIHAIDTSLKLNKKLFLATRKMANLIAPTDMLAA